MTTLTFDRAVAEIALSPFRSEMRNDFSKLESRFDQKISEAKIDIIKWMFGGFLTIAIMIIGLFIKLV